jgi:precorrin-2 dehydrogenase/sirohydrochlorin ferrochelatase
MLPLLVSLDGRRAVVVGGGPVGRRKAGALLDAGANVRLVCREARPAEVSERLDWVVEEYRAAHLDGAALACACGPAELNARVVADARARGVWVHSASDPASGDLVFPAVVRRGGLLVAVGTGGAAPALARAIAARLEGEFDNPFADWVDLLAELRPLVRGLVEDAVKRRRVYERLAEWRWLERLRAEGRDKVREAMRAEVEAVL